MYKFINEEENPKRITSVEIKDDGLTIWQVKDLFIDFLLGCGYSPDSVKEEIGEYSE